MSDVRHVYTADMFNWKLLKHLFESAESIRRKAQTKKGRNELLDSFRGNNITLLFEAHSTRTFTSFYRAAQDLGMKISGIQDPNTSSMYKGESLAHTVRVLTGYEAHVVVLRLKETGMVKRIAEVMLVPVINAGDGDGEHPTQALVDTYTIWREFDTLHGLTYVFAGDLLRGRTCHSDIRVLSQWKDNRFILVSPPELALPQDLKQMLDQRGCQYQETTELSDALPQGDVVYQTRIQKERAVTGPDGEEIDLNHLKTMRIGRKELELMSGDSILMHPLPIDQTEQEITNEVSDIGMQMPADARPSLFKKVRCFEQSDNGLPIRRALLKWVQNGG